MDVNSIRSTNTNYSASYVSNTSTKTDSSAKNAATDSTYVSLGKDTFEKSTETIYESYKPTAKKKLSSDEVNALKQQQKDNETKLLNDFVKQTMSNQTNYKSSLSNDFSNLLTKVFGSVDNALPALETDPAKAKAALEGDGAYSVKSVSDRIMKLAEAIAGDDPDKIQKMRDAVEKGFKAAGLDFTSATGNKKLPQICQDTYTEVMDRFDKWQNKNSTSTPDDTIASANTTKNAAE